MSTTQKVVEKLCQLSPEQQAEVLQLVETLANRNPLQAEPLSPFGLWKDLNFTIAEEEIDQARRKMWGSFPREDIV